MGEKATNILFIRIASALLLLTSFGGCNAIVNRLKGDSVPNVDLEDAIWLRATPEALATDTEGVPPAHGGTTPTPVHDLFSLRPGTQVGTASLGGAIDPTGTTIVNDFDGDGILNANETTTNVWVADYPMIEAVVATPVTMKIRIDVSSTGSSDEIVSEITSDEAQTNKTEGSEKIHQSELNLRTVQFQDSFARSDELNKSTTTSTSGGLNTNIGLSIISSIGMNYSNSRSDSWGSKNSTSETTTKWADKPFKNNLDRDAWSVKSDVSAQKARKYRKDITSKVNVTSKVDPNAGYVRAPLFIKNLSVNMPVHLTNILCSLMFETPAGELIPVQSFRLRNDDYSLFSVDVYGGSEFGPYVIELNGLNTAEVQNAIALGYSPKIFIVDYEMTHVADSNYRSMLLNFSGENLKIVEENAKGRTAQIKVFGRGMREKFRIAAFSTNSVGDPCQMTAASSFAPGVTLREALTRLACSGIEVQFEDYVVDLSSIAPALGEPRMHIKGIKSIGGLKSTIPCEPGTYTGSDGVTRTACIQKPYSSWTKEEKEGTGVWAIYSVGKYYSSTDYWKDGSLVRKYDPSIGAKAASMVKGVDATVWPGDYYDLVYISFKDFIAREESHGTNPLETEAEFDVNTRWDLASLGDRPYDPDTRSTYLGQVGFGEQIELTVQLKGTRYLSPSFGVPEDSGSFEYFSDFSYAPQKSSRRFSIDEAADFELSLGFGGSRSDWLHVVKDLDNSDSTRPRNCGRTLDYVAQTYTLCVQLPTVHPYVDASVSLVRLYIRPSLNSAYRNTVWPLRYSDVRKMRGELGAPATKGDMSIIVARGSGVASVGDTLYITGDTTPYRIAAVGTAGADGSYPVDLESSVREDQKATTPVYIPGGLGRPEVGLAVDKGFLSDWNADAQGSFQTDQWAAPQNRPMLTGNSVSCTTWPFHVAGCLGFTSDLNALNWMGAWNEGVALWNSWSDGGAFANFLSGGLKRLAASTGRSYRLQSLTQDFAVSEAVGAAAYSKPVVLTLGNTAVTVWQAGTVLKVRSVDIETGVPMGHEFQVNTAPAPNGFVARSFGDRVTVAWDNGQGIYATVLDAVTLARVGTELAVTGLPSQDAGASLRYDLAAGNGKAMVVWNYSFLSSAQVELYPGCRFHNPSNPSVCFVTDYYNEWGLQARGIDTTVGSLSGSAFASYADSQTTRSSYNPRSIVPVLAGTGDSFAVFAYVSDRDTGHLWMGARVVSSTANSSPWLEILPWAVNQPGTPVAFTGAGTTDRAFVVWKYANGTVYGRGVNTASAALLGSGDLALASGVDEMSLSQSGSLAFVMHTTSGQLQMTAVNLMDGQRRFSNPANLGVMHVSARHVGSAAVAGDRIVAFWDQEDQGRRTVVGRSLDGTTFEVLGPGEFMVSTKNAGVQIGPAAATSGNRGLAVWLSQDADQPRIRGYSLDVINPGALSYGLNNFFVAPLIERDYTIRARIRY